MKSFSVQCMMWDEVTPQNNMFWFGGLCPIVENVENEKEAIELAIDWFMDNGYNANDNATADYENAEITWVENGVKHALLIDVKEN